MNIRIDLNEDGQFVLTVVAEDCPAPGVPRIIVPPPGGGSAAITFTRKQTARLALDAPEAQGYDVSALRAARPS